MLLLLLLLLLLGCLNEGDDLLLHWLLDELLLLLQLLLIATVMHAYMVAIKITLLGRRILAMLTREGLLFWHVLVGVDTYNVSGEVTLPAGGVATENALQILFLLRHGSYVVLASHVSLVVASTCSFVFTEATFVGGFRRLNSSLV